ncbi:hypothetical protein K438DRAFT_1775572 [Mycena galopus ATCC 62051]|nr:hypothetical protein K438DRAFT_1775572 [Mycena galopus ATCC 62051]
MTSRGIDVTQNRCFVGPAKPGREIRSEYCLELELTLCKWRLTRLGIKYDFPPGFDVQQPDFSLNPTTFHVLRKFPTVLMEVGSELNGGQHHWFDPLARWWLLPDSGVRIEGPSRIAPQFHKCEGDGVSRPPDAADIYSATFCNSSLTLEMSSSHTPSKSTFESFSQKKRIYIACITDSEETPCKRCVERNIDCEYLPVCVEREQALFAPEALAQSSRSPATPTWNQQPHGPGGSSAHYGRDNYGHQNMPANPYYGQQQFNQSAGLPYANPAPGGHSSRPPAQQQFPTNSSHMYATNTQRPPTQPTTYLNSNSGMPYQPPASQVNYNSANPSNVYYTNSNYSNYRYVAAATLNGVY